MRLVHFVLLSSLALPGAGLAQETEQHPRALRASIEAASATERSNAPSRTGSATWRTARAPVSLRPRRRRK